MLNTLRYFRRKFKAHHVDAYSAQAAFFLLCSFVPLLLVLFSLVKLFTVNSEDFFDAFNKFFPSFINQWTTDVIHEVFNQKSAGTTCFSAITVVWSASKSIYYIVGGLNTIFELKESRPFWSVRILSILFTFALIIVVIFMVLLMVFGSAIADSIVDVFPALANFQLAILTARYAIGFVVLTIFFSCIFKVLPAHRASLCEMIPGAVVSASGWIVFSALFGLYIDHFSDYSKLYGGLTSIVLFLLWLYFCMQILFFGAELSLLLRKIK